MRAVNICCSSHHQQVRKKLKMDYSIFSMKSPLFTSRLMPGQYSPVFCFPFLSTFVKSCSLHARGQRATMTAGDERC